MSPLALYLHTYSLRFHLAHQPGFDVFAFIERAAAEGFGGVALSANDVNYRHLGGRDPARLGRIRQAVAAVGLRCDMDTSGTDPAHLGAMLDVARQIGAEQVRTYTRYRGAPDVLVRRTIQDLRAVAPLAERFGIRVMLENHETFTGAEIAHVLAAVDSPWIGALYDYGNSQMVMEEPLAALEAMAPWVMSAHLKDNVLLRPEDSPDGQLAVLGMPIGEGNLPILAQTRRLVEVGLDRIVFENSWGYRAPVRPERLTAATRRILGQGSFAFAEPPLRNERYLLHPERFTPAQLVAMEDEAHQRSLTWLRRAFAAAGIEIGR
jgi:sugar phosphate isomerase/epimerase